MRAYRGAHLVTGRGGAARQRLRIESDEPRSFLSSYNGSCRGCGMPYQKGDPIKSPGKGKGAYHPRCLPKKKQGIFG